MKKQIVNSTLALTLAAGMMFGSLQLPIWGNASTTVGVQDAYAATSEDLLNNMEALQAYASKTMPDNTDITKAIAELCSPFTTAANIYNSATLFLKMTGVMKDPTATALANIQSTLTEMNIVLNNMNETLKNVAKELEELAIFEQESDRAGRVQSMLDVYSEFNDHHMEVMQDLMNKYEDQIIKGFREWYNGEKDEICIYYAMDHFGKIIQTYCYDSGDPAYSAEGYRVKTSDTIKISKEAVAHAMEHAGKFDVNTYRQEIIDCLTDEIIVQADAGTLHAGIYYYNTWHILNADEKRETAARTAEEAFNSLSSSISKERMENCDLSTDAYNAFRGYCDGLTGLNSVLDAELKILYLTHSFEGEVKKEVENVINTIGLTTGAYATMTLSMMHQNSGQSDARINNTIGWWTAVTNKLDTAKKTALTGYDNYCYITNSLINYEERTMEFSNTLTLARNNSWVTYKGNSCKPSTLFNEGDKLLDNIYTTMLYHQGKALDENSSFAKYLDKNKVGIGKRTTNKLVTKCDPWMDFSPNEQIPMNKGYRAKDSGSDYWGETFTTIVNKGNSSDIENQYFSNCKIMRGTTVNLTNDTFTSDDILAAMAAYGESHCYWLTDEGYLMGNAASCKKTVQYYDEWIKSGYYHLTSETTCTFTVTYGILVPSALPKTVEISADSPIAAFDYCQVLDDLSTFDAPVYNVEESEVINPDWEEIAAEKENQVIPETEDSEAEVMPETEDSEVEVMPEAEDSEVEVMPEAETSDVTVGDVPVLLHCYSWSRTSFLVDCHEIKTFCNLLPISTSNKKLPKDDCQE